MPLSRGCYILITVLICMTELWIQGVSAFVLRVLYTNHCVNLHNKIVSVTLSTGCSIITIVSICLTELWLQWVCSFVYKVYLCLKSNSKVQHFVFIFYTANEKLKKTRKSIIYLFVIK